MGTELVTKEFSALSLLGVAGISPLRFPRGVLCTTSHTTDSRPDHVRLPAAIPLWIPAVARMTVVVHSTPWASRERLSRIEVRMGSPLDEG